MVFIIISIIKQLLMSAFYPAAIWGLVKVCLMIQNKFRDVTSSNDRKRKLTKCLIQEVETLPDKKDAEVIIVGSGVGGSALAAFLAKEGLKVIVIDKNYGYSKTITGEVLQPGGINCLNSLNLSETYKNIDAVETYGYTLTSHRFDTNITLPYNCDLNKKESRTNALIFHHGRFLSKLRQASDNHKNVTKMEGYAHKLITFKDRIIGVIYTEKHSQKSKVLLAPITVIAEGHFSKFRPLFVPPNIKPTRTSYFLGILIETPKAKKDLNDQAPTSAESILGTPSFITIYQVSSIHTRVVIDIVPPLPINLKEYVQNIICPQLPMMYKKKVWEAMDEKKYETEDDISKFKKMPNSYLCTQPCLIPGTILIGDIINIRHPVTGAGMTVALKDVVYWSHEVKKLYHEHDQNFSINDDLLIKKIHQLQRSFIKARCRNYTFTTDVLAQVLAKIYAPNNDKIIEEIQCNCVHYFELGGFFVRGPMEMVSMNNTSPYLLIVHLLCMPIYGIGRSLWLRIKNQKHWSGYLFVIYDLTQILSTSLKIVAPLMWREIKVMFPFLKYLNF